MISSAPRSVPLVDRTKPKAWRWNSLWISASFHLLLIGLLGSWYLPKRHSPPVALKTEDQIASPITPSPPAINPANIPAEKIKASLESQFQSTANRSNETNLKSLDRNLERMQRSVKPESVSELVQAVAGSLNIDTTMYADKKPVAGTTFDPNTAQLTSVERTANADGSWSYEATMVDRNGNRSTVPMTPAEGATAYEAFEKIKSLPMAAALYQQLVMPIMQQMVAPENSRPPGNSVIVPAATESTDVPIGKN